MHHLRRGICGKYLEIIKKTQKITTYNQSDMETYGFGPIMVKNIKIVKLV